MNRRSEEMEAQRLSEALTDVESGREPKLDARADAELASLVETSSLLRRTWASIAPGAAYISRSRAFILQSITGEEQERAVVETGVVEAAPAQLLPFYRRWTVLSPVASAAAAAAITFAITIWATGDGATTSPVAGPALASAQPAAAGPATVAPAAPVFVEPARPPLVSDVSTDGSTLQAALDEALGSEPLVAQLERIAAILAEIRERADSGQPVDASLLRLLSEGTASVAAQIESNPDAITPLAVANYFHSVSPGRGLLDSTQVEAGGEDALETARAATADGLAVAVRYFSSSQALAASSGPD